MVHLKISQAEAAGLARYFILAQTGPRFELFETFRERSFAR